MVAWQRLARFRHAANAVRKHLPAAERKSLLDVGAADGIGLPFLRPLAERMLSVNYYEEHTQEFRAAHPSDPVMTADVRSLPLEDGAYDVVVSFETLHLLPDWGAREQAIHEIHRVLRPGGLFVFSVPIETGFAALFKYAARRATGNQLDGMTLGLALKHALSTNGKITSLDDGHQVGFSAARFVELVAKRFEIRDQRPVPIRVLLPMNLLVVACKQE